MNLMHRVSINKIIDDEGRLFGTGNVVDALVVLLVVAVVVAGAALVFGGNSEPEPDIGTTYSNLQKRLLISCCGTINMAR